MSQIASLLLSPSLSFPLIPAVTPNPRRVPSVLFKSSGRLAAAGVHFPAITFAVSEPNASNYLDEEESILPLLEELSGCLGLPTDYLSNLPGDLRLDLNDAAFDLANGPVLDELVRLHAENEAPHRYNFVVWQRSWGTLFKFVSSMGASRHNDIKHPSKRTSVVV
ncbi:uncharacterized protein LOC110034934 [Phalaenopsis equestris]|uniref:uncharacterized protein LOC110034934 n=1 Tax=Phalaenopsis equestris TaxID=78828 RepID=UPI0009E2C55E|nr:uncharacterized protein LOC110034934 [Phalaenopsis equestris]